MTETKRLRRRIVSPAAEMRWPRRCILGLLLGAAFVLAPVRAQAQEMEVPVDAQIPLFLKVATFDRQLHARAHDAIVVAIAYQSGNRASLNARDDALRAFEHCGSSLDGLPLRI